MIIWVNQDAIRKNGTALGKVRKLELFPVFSMAEQVDGLLQVDADALELYYDGNKIGEFIYSPREPLPNGARVYFKSIKEVTIKKVKKDI